MARPNKLYSHLEILLHAPIASSDGRRTFRQGEIVRIEIDPEADVRVYRRNRTKQVDCLFEELFGAEILRTLDEIET